MFSNIGSKIKSLKSDWCFKADKTGIFNEKNGLFYDTIKSNIQLFFGVYMNLKERTIFHIDVNSAYLSWEALECLKKGNTVDLRTVPSIVAGDPSKRHGIVLAKSIPAKKYGIVTGEPVFQAIKKCPDLVMVPPSHDVYARQSQAMTDLLLRYTPYIRRNTGLTKRGDIWGIDRLFDDFFNDSFFGRWVNTPVRADIRETENEWLIDAELPGVDKNDIQIDLNDGLLTISVEQKKEVNEENENYIRRERAYGNYKRSFYVEDVKEEDIKAVYKDGILSLVLPKEKPDKKKKVKIDVQ